MKKSYRNLPQRRGATLVLSAFLMVAMLAMVAFAIDCGFMLTTRTQLQVAADSSALAAAQVMGSTITDPITKAKEYASYHKASGRNVQLNDSDIEYGVWDAGARTFTSTGSVLGNAIRVTTRLDANHGGQAPTFFGRMLGVNGFNAQAQAVAMGNPRDICFVVDLSGSMNRDTAPGYGSTPSYRSTGYTSIYQSMMQQVFSDFGFGTYPGTTQKIGQPLGSSVTWSGSGSTGIYSTTGPLSKASFTLNGVTTTLTSTYKIASGDSGSTAQTKAYKWMIDYQVKLIMPNAKPAPNSSSSYTYWQAYLAAITSNSGVIGYRTYVQWMMDQGRDDTDGGQYCQLSVSSPNCPYHNESTAGGTFAFPPSEQPTHSERRAVIAGLQEIKNRNSSISDSTQKDWVSIVTFDRVASTATRLGLTSNYDTAMESCTTMQAVGYTGSSTATETGLIAGYNLIKPKSQGGTGRENTQKVVVLLTDGVANLQTSSNSAVSSYRSTYPSPNFYGGSGSYPSDAALMQANIMKTGRWKMFALALGLDIDYDFMDRMARMGGTANDDGQAPRTSGDPSAYEAEMSALLKKIVDNPQVRMVQ